MVRLASKLIRKSIFKARVRDTEILSMPSSMAFT